MSIQTGFIYADVILPLPLENVYTYAIPPEMGDSVFTGSRVIVSFGSKKRYTGIIKRLYKERPDTTFEIKEISGILDQNPIVRENQLTFWDWISNYYQAALGDVYKAAVPSGLKLESETIISPNENIENSDSLKENEKTILSIIKKYPKISVEELSKASGIKNIFPIIKGLMEKSVVLISEELKTSFKPKRATFISLSAPYQSEENSTIILESLKRSKKQQEVLSCYLNRCPNFEEIERSLLVKETNTTTGVINELVKKGIFNSWEKEIDRIKKSDNRLLSPKKELNRFQQAAYLHIKQSFAKYPATLLHGVTSSGKTEIYIKLIQETLDKGEQALYLLPEIALTAQITTRLRNVFGNQLGIYHSKFSDNERVEIWNNLLLEKEYKVILGVRSSIFLPFKKLGLIIVDEEHENTYKQYDPAPRYNAKNVAVVLGRLHGADVLLGSATPSIESYYNALNKKFGLVEIKQRFEEIEMPEIIPVDMIEARHKKQFKSLFSSLLLSKMDDALSKKEQIILFQNRRGFAPFIECQDCGWVPKCIHCDVSLTYHKSFNQLTCHYCGHTQPIPVKCPNCQSEKIKTKGFGTEKVEEEIKKIFPEATVARMDLDTTRSKRAYEDIIHAFEEKKIDILIGTQMISKGLDFGDVSIVGILNADNMLQFPDFRSYERAFQLMAQVSGRAGRKNKQGTVIVQTNDIHNTVIQKVIKNDYEGMYYQEIEERKLFKYPPFYRMITILIKHKDLSVANDAAKTLAFNLRNTFKERVLGPDNPIISRIQSFFLKKIILKFENEISAEKTKLILKNEINRLKSDNKYKSVIINLDVDPM